jgi:LysM repeat protein
MGEQFNPEFVMNLRDSTVTADTLYVTAQLFRHLERFPHRVPQDRYVPDAQHYAHLHDHDGHDHDHEPASPPQAGARPAQGGDASPVTPTSLASVRAHYVRSGDTLSAIATRYGTSVSRLCQINGIAPTTLLQIGQRIRLP